jgi:hypothetical protein
MSITIGDIAGLTACIFFVALLIFVHNMTVKVIRPDAEENKDNHLDQFFIWTLRGSIAVFSLVPFGFFAMLYLTNNPHVLDFLIFK